MPVPCPIPQNESDVLPPHDAVDQLACPWPLHVEVYRAHAAGAVIEYYDLKYPDDPRWHTTRCPNWIYSRFLYRVLDESRRRVPRSLNGYTLE